MKEKFREINLRKQSLALITHVNAAVANYQAQGLRLSLRQLFYSLVTKNIIPNTEKSYKGLSSVVADGRLAGLIDWDAIEDRIRMPRSQPEWSSIQSLVDCAVQGYRLPRWEGQDFYVELWVEKDALAGVLSPLGREYHVTMMVNRGYSSVSAMHEASKRFIESDVGEEKKGILLYLGDFDPSGEDMVRDIAERLEMFGATVLVNKIALTMPQIKQYNPPPNPAKMTDPRAVAFVAQHGSSSWEVDALPPNVLQGLIRNELNKYVDQDKMDEVKDREEDDRAALRKAAAKL